jgi:uncharacterized protein
MKKPFEEIYTEVTKYLDSKLPKHLTYHSTEHTKYVVKLAEYIAIKENLSEYDIYLIKVAALYHDMGFIISPKDHEAKSCMIAREELPKYNFNKEEIEKICGMIMATKIPQNPKNKQEEVLADADLEYLGTSKFNEISQKLFEELKHFNKDITEEKWNEIQINFIGNHKYHTRFCKHYKEFRKQKNLKNLADS